MRTHLRIGRLFGVPVGINWSVLIVGVLLTVSLAKFSLPAAAPDHAESSYWFGGVLGLIGFMVSLVGHETGHSYIAGRNNVKVAEITLWLFGGVAKLEREADDPGAEFRIAAAGPAMNFVMAAVFGLGFWASVHWGASDVLQTLLVWLCAVNVVLAVSNLLPAYPLDGGQMLRAVLWRRSGRKITATRRATLLGQIFGAALMVIALGVAIWVSRWSGLWIGIMGLFIFVPARAGWKASGPQPELLEWSVGALGRRLPRPMMCNSTIAELERTLFEHPDVPLVPVFDESGQVASLVMPDAVLRVPPAQRGLVPISSFMEPIYSLPRVHPTETVAAVLARLGHGRAWRAVVSDGSSVEGVLCSEDVEEIVDLATA